jgi:cellulose synthase/poly-beta-1,6-N-acetylglucosamine synthase-like glycosyltransferase
MSVFLAWLFWGAAGLVTYTYVGYPAWMYLRSRLHPRGWQQIQIWPSVSVILVVHNGAALLRRQISRLLSLNYPSNLVSLIVVSDGSSDETEEILDSVRHPSVKSIVCRERRGKAAAINVGIQNASGEVVLFVDIRPSPDRDALQLLVRNFADPKVGCAAGKLVLSDEGHAAGAKAIGGVYWRYEQWIRECESQVDSPLGVYGGFYAVRRELIRALPEGAILDDMLQPLSVIRQGYRSVIDVRARVYDVWPKNLRSEFNRKVRTLAGNFQVLQLAPWILSSENRLRFELISHKLFRLLVPALLVVLLASSAILALHSRTYFAAFAAQALLYALAALGERLDVPILLKIAGAARAFCAMNLAVVVGLYKFLLMREELWKIWIPTTRFSASASADQEELTPTVAGD